jgi:alkylation response protein AidB-like acyl-CoA dehydrogenase
LDEKMDTKLEAQLALPCFENFDAFSKAVLSQDKSNSMDAALNIGLRCSNLSQAFAVAYRCALQALVPQLNQTQWAAMCVTEQQGNHPRHIQTHLHADGTISGEKSFVSMAGLARQLLVITKVADAQEHDGRPELKVVLVDTDQAHVRVDKMPSMKMLADIPHGRLSLEHATCEILPGDGYAQYSKVFRVLEDAHILMAASAFILNTAYRVGQVEVVAKALSIIGLLKGMDLKSGPWAHIQLAQAFEQFLTLSQLFEESLAVYDETLAQAWLADKKLFAIASGARQARTDKAMNWLKTKGEG